MNRFYADLRKYKTVSGCAKEVALVLGRIIDDGNSKILEEKYGINIGLLKPRIELERMDNEEYEKFMDECRRNPVNHQKLEEIKQRIEDLYGARKQGFYDGKKMYNNSEMKEIGRKMGI